MASLCVSPILCCIDPVCGESEANKQAHRRDIELELHHRLHRDRKQHARRHGVIPARCECDSRQQSAEDKRCWNPRLNRKLQQVVVGKEPGGVRLGPDLGDVGVDFGPPGGTADAQTSQVRPVAVPP